MVMMNAKDQRFLNSFYRLVTRVLTHEQEMATNPEYRAAHEREQAEFAAERDRREAAEKAKTQAAMKDDSAYYTSPDFREEVIEEIVASGATRLQAEGRTRNQLRLFKEARELG